MSKKKKMRFEVQDGETISDCLDRMAKEGYQPVRRIEKPVFSEEKQGQNVHYEPFKQQIMFEGILVEGER
ncbi:NETI motif-containing protein [Alkalihalobacillus pseudalcaliphilus]|uniref:NETI motif-containing protein n=1 Tax=Alkalihalobacillus pseudalcaliphilus TaxID=79884 RepID=UPI00064DB78A|nr:NETI motif-containing protein [Alkalihalobacillus pseudalcaliphilus]KMK75321.1 hypothetical protein AB990_18075 [Alkalihalobacillus pseudalcaliphilus]